MREIKVQEIPDMLVQRHHVELAIDGLLASPVNTEGVENLGQRHTSLTERILNFMGNNPAALSCIREREQAKLIASAGMLAVLHTNPDQEAPHGQEQEYAEATMAFLGRSSIIVRQIDSLLPTESRQVEEKSPEFDAIKGKEGEALNDPAMHILIRDDGVIEINGQPLEDKLELLPVQRYLFERFIDASEPIRESTIYKSEEFVDLIKSLGQKDDAPSAYGNALRGMLRKIEKAGLPDFIQQVAGGPRSRVVEVQYKLEIEDQALLERTTELVDALFDNMEIGQAVDIDAALSELLELKDKGSIRAPRFDQLKVKAIKALEEELNGDGLKLDITGHNIVLRETVAEQTNTFVPQSAEPTGVVEVPGISTGAFVSLDNGILAFENRKFKLSEVQQEIVRIILGGGQQGVGSSHIRQKLRESGLSTKGFQTEFARLKEQLGPVLKRNVHTRSGSMRFKLQKKN